jgi:hypothetical protein
VETVRNHVKSVIGVIDDSKKKQLKEEEMKADMRAEMAFKSSAQPFGAPRSGGFGAAGASFGAVSGSGPAGAFTGDMPEKGVSSRGLMLESRMSAVFQTASMEMALSPATRSSASSGAERSKGFRSLKMSKATSATSLEHAQQPSTLDVPLKEHHSDGSGSPLDGRNGTDDFTMIPKILDAALENCDSDNAVKSTIIKAGSTWTRTRQENFLTGPKVNSLGSDEILTEKKKVFDLLDAISRSGTLPIDCSELHVFVAVSHCFDNDVMGTVIQDNVNPIQKLERSSLLLASTIYGKPPTTLIGNELNRQRLRGSFPLLFSDDLQDAIEEDLRTSEGGEGI